MLEGWPRQPSQLVMWLSTSRGCGRSIMSISLSRRGEIVGLIGPNGAGKTTLINVLTGFQKVSRGTVHMDGNDIGDWKPHKRSRRGLVRTFQSVLPFAGLTAQQNVEAGALAAGLAWSEARKSATELLVRLGLAGKEHRKVGTLPFGEERRVGIARALAMRPRYLLMDEPAAGLNDHECTELMQIIRDIRCRSRLRHPADRASHVAGLFTLRPHPGAADGPHDRDRYFG